MATHQESSRLPGGRLPGAMARPDGWNDLTRGITVVIEGFFGMAWFNWLDRSQRLPGWLQVVTIAGTVLAGLAMVAGVVVAVRAHRRGEPSRLQDPAARRRYLIIVWAEIVVLFGGAAVLGASGGQQWVPVLVAFGVGLHFVPLAGVFGDPRLVPLGVAVMVVALAALVAGLRTDAAPANITGPGAGLCLLLGAGVALASTRPPDLRTVGSGG